MDKWFANPSGNRFKSGLTLLNLGKVFHSSLHISFSTLQKLIHKGGVLLLLFCQLVNNLSVPSNSIAVSIANLSEIVQNILLKSERQKSMLYWKLRRTRGRSLGYPSCTPPEFFASPVPMSEAQHSKWVLWWFPDVLKATYPTQPCTHASSDSSSSSSELMISNPTVFGKHQTNVGTTSWAPTGAEACLAILALLWQKLRHW